MSTLEILAGLSARNSCHRARFVPCSRFANICLKFLLDCLSAIELASRFALSRAGHDAANGGKSKASSLKFIEFSTHKAPAVALSPPSIESALYCKVPSQATLRLMESSHFSYLLTGILQALFNSRSAHWSRGRCSQSIISLLPFIDRGP